MIIFPRKRERDVCIYIYNTYNIIYIYIYFIYIIFLSLSSTYTQKLSWTIMILWPGESRQPQPQPWTISWQYMGQLGMVSTTHSWWYWDGLWNWVYHITVFRSKVFFQLDYCRRKFRSQTSDNMDRWKSRGGKSQRGEEKKKEDQRRERGRRQRMQVREKVANLRKTVFFQWFVAPEGRKVGLLL